MLELVILQGLPASGKSSWAKEFINGKHNWVIVSRDSIRESTGEYWVPSRENYITEIEEFSVTSALKNNLNVVVDASNLNESRNIRWNYLVNQLKDSDNIDVKLTFKFFPISIKEAIERDKSRERKVGEKTIINFARKYLPDEYKEYYTDSRIFNQREHDLNKKDCIICDLDGTICLHNGGSPYDYSKVSTDILNKDLLSILSYLSNIYTIIFVSGREGTEQCKNDSKDWIYKNINISSNSKELKFYFRKERDYRPDEEVKEEILKNDIYPFYNVIAVFDDRDKVVNMWRNNNLLICQVNYGNF